MAVGGLGQHAAARRALHEALLHQIRLDHLLDHVALLAKRRRQGLDADRAAAVIVGDAAQIAPVHRVEPAAVDLEPQQRRVGGSGVDLLASR